MRPSGSLPYRQLRKSGYDEAGRATAHCRTGSLEIVQCELVRAEYVHCRTGSILLSLRLSHEYYKIVINPI